MVFFFFFTLLPSHTTIVLHFHNFWLVYPRSFTLVILALDMELVNNQSGQINTTQINWVSKFNKSIVNLQQIIFLPNYCQWKKTAKVRMESRQIAVKVKSRMQTNVIQIQQRWKWSMLSVWEKSFTYKFRKRIAMIFVLLKGHVV